VAIYAQENKEVKYFRQLRYNHVSPYITISGTYPIDKATAQTTSHYIFEYDNAGRLTSIVNNHYFSERLHPLASIGAYLSKIAYEKDKIIRTFYDKNRERITNDRAVYKEVYYLKKGFQYKMAFYNLEDQPMVSNWNIAEYHWSKKGKLIIEKRFNLNGEAASLSPYFNFGTTGILLNKLGQPKAHYNLNEKFKPMNNEVGIASYQDVYDENENHIIYSYHDANDDLRMNQWNFAIGKKTYDNIGNLVAMNRLDTNEEEVSSNPVYTNTTIKLASKATKKDSTEIKEKSLGYLLSLQNLKPDLMNEVMNDSLNKVTIGYDRATRKEFARAATKEQMIDNAANWNKANNKFPTKPDNQVIILDIYDRMASVKLISDNWVEYLHLIKLDNNWSIINLSWQYKDIDRY
jgi:hypothetical protein